MEWPVVDSRAYIVVVCGFVFGIITYFFARAFYFIKEPEFIIHGEEIRDVKYSLLFARVFAVTGYVSFFLAIKVFIDIRKKLTLPYTFETVAMCAGIFCYCFILFIEVAPVKKARAFYKVCGVFKLIDYFLFPY